MKWKIFIFVCLLACPILARPQEPITEALPITKTTTTTKSPPSATTTTTTTIDSTKDNHSRYMNKSSINLGKIGDMSGEYKLSSNYILSNFLKTTIPDLKKDDLNNIQSQNHSPQYKDKNRDYPQFVKPYETPHLINPTIYSQYQSPIEILHQEDNPNYKYYYNTQSDTKLTHVNSYPVIITTPSPYLHQQFSQINRPGIHYVTSIPVTKTNIKRPVISSGYYTGFIDPGEDPDPDYDYRFGINEELKLKRNKTKINKNKNKYVISVDDSDDVENDNAEEEVEEEIEEEEVEEEVEEEEVPEDEENEEETQNDEEIITKRCPSVKITVNNTIADFSSKEDCSDFQITINNNFLEKSPPQIYTESTTTVKDEVTTLKYNQIIDSAELDDASIEGDGKKKQPQIEALLVSKPSHNKPAKGSKPSKGRPSKGKPSKGRPSKGKPTQPIIIQLPHLYGEEPHLEEHSLEVSIEHEEYEESSEEEPNKKPHKKKKKKRRKPHKRPNKMDKIKKKKKKPYDLTSIVDHTNWSSMLGTLMKGVTFLTIVNPFHFLPFLATPIAAMMIGGAALTMYMYPWSSPGLFFGRQSRDSTRRTIVIHKQAPRSRWSRRPPPGWFDDSRRRRRDRRNVNNDFEKVLRYLKQNNL